MTQEMTLKRSISYKDPSKTMKSSSISWNQFDHNPTKQLDKLIRPNIVEMDAQGCQRIIEKINQDVNYKEL